MEFDVRVKTAIYQHFAATAQAPSLAQVAAQVRSDADTVRLAYAQLRAQRVLFLEPDGESIRMAPPFSGVPTQHRVIVGPRKYVANCAWDALGIVAALHKPGVVLSICAQSGVPLRLRVALEGPAPSTWIFHCLVPASQWWNDLVFT